MFLNFYGLSEQPFGVTPDPDFLYLGATHREALASVAYGIQSGVGFAAVIAKPGMGKTTLLFALLRHFQNSAQSAFVFDTQCNSKELLQNLLAEFKIPQESGKNDASALACLRQFLLKSARANQRVLVVVDEAQNLDIPVFETLRLLSNFETPHAKLLHIVLAGQPELGRKLALPELEQLRQRITIVSRLDVFAPADVIRYVVHRLKRAGYRGAPLFTPEALGILVDKSHGVPREINRLCFNALSLGCALGKKVIDGQMVREAAADLEFGSLPNQEETAQGRGVSETTDDALAALFSTALTAPALAKEEAERITVGQELQRTESERTVVAGTEQQPQTAPPLIPEESKAGQEERAGYAAESSAVSASLSGVSGTAAAPRLGVRNAFGQIAQKMRGLRTKRATVAAGSRQSRRFGFRRVVWLWSLAVVAAAVFGGLIWLSNPQSATTLASQFVSATQKSVGQFASATQKSFRQWLTSLQPAFASEKEKPRSELNSSAPESVSEASPTSPTVKPALTAETGDKGLSAAGTTASVSVTPAAGPGNHNQRGSQATRLLNGRAASTGSKVPATRHSAALAGTPAMSHFAASAVGAASGAGATATPASPIVNETANPPAPETTIAAKLTKWVDPVYPQQAHSSGISGGVELNAHIDEAGKVQAVQAISGDPGLASAAMDAVRQWEYQPSSVNGEPRQSDARIVIVFSLR